MKVRSTRRSFLSIESVAMTDIVMNLFIFFFISFSLLYTFNPERTKESKIEVKLPQGASAPSERSPAAITVVVTSGNEIYIDGDRVQTAALKKALSGRAKDPAAASLVVKADREASVDTLMKVLDTAKQIGIQKLGVAVESPAQEPSRAR